MFKRKNFYKDEAQIMVEYVLVIGLVIIMLMTMLPIIARMSQSMMKIAADQVGNQQNGEQEFGPSGHLVSEYTSTRANTNKYLDHYADAVTYRYDDRTGTTKDALMNLGVVPGLGVR